MRKALPMRRENDGRRGAAASEGILLTIGVAVALLVAATLFGRRLVGLQATATRTLD